MIRSTDVPTPFSGFSSGTTRITSLPEAFFTELLPAITDIAELKVTLYAFWAIQQMEGEVRFLRLKDLLKDRLLLMALPSGGDSPEQTLDAALKRAVDRGTFLMIDVPELKEKYYLFNTERSRTALDAYQKGTWSPVGLPGQNVGLDLDKPQIFKLYEQNIGMITPLLADQLKLAEQEYPVDWISDAIQEAVKNNVRRWAYIQRILESWRERGRNAKYR